jgi:hypothetical protein
MEWILPSDEETPSLPDGYVVSFMHFHERGLMTPTHQFLRELLHYHKIELQHLNPNGIQHTAAFVSLCEGFMGIETLLQPMEVLFRHQSTEEEGEEPVRSAHANGVRKHPSLEQPGHRVHVPTTVVILQRMAQVVVLFEE